MSKIYVPAKIASAEQAEALPVGTVAIEADHSMAYIRSDGNPPWYASTDGNAWVEHEEMIDRIALVPTEARLETRYPYPDADIERVRLTTEWSDR